MQRPVNPGDLFSASAHRAAGVYHTVRAQPGWVTRMAAMAFFIIVAVPVVALLLMALITAVFVFSVLALGHAAVLRIRRLFPSDDGRENVIVRRR